MNCKICGKVVSRGSKKGFCQHCCKVGALNPQFKKGAPKCQVCGKDVKYYKAKICLECYLSSVQHDSKKDHTFCKCGKKIKYTSKQCNSCRMKEYWQKHPDYMNQENHWNWKDGSSKETYPKEYYRIRDSIIERDNHECQNCKITQEEHLIVWGSDIEVHHIDYNKENNIPENLLSLCKPCNVRANYNRPFWQEKFEKVVIQRN